MLLALVAALAMLAPATARAGWSAPFRLSGPAPLDLLPPQLAFSAGGESLIAFGAQDEDNPSGSSGAAMVRLPGGSLRKARTVPGAAAILDVAFDGSTFDVLTGTRVTGAQCCAAAQLVRVNGAGAFVSRQTLTGQLYGPTAGALAPIGGGEMVAAVASGSGVFAAQSSGAGHFGSAARLSPSGVQPEAIALTSLGGGRSMVAWTAALQPEDADGPRSISIATGSSRHAPSGRRSVVIVAPGHRIDEIALGVGKSAPTTAWTESWYDAAGAYHSEVVVADLTRKLRPHPFGVAGEIPSGMSLASNGAGAQVLAWKQCASSGACEALVATRSSGGTFTPLQVLGAIDAGETPVAAIASNGDALVGWVAAGHVLAAERGPRASRFEPHVVSSTSFASNLALAFGSRGQAIATWLQGTLAPSVEGAVYRAS